VTGCPALVPVNMSSETRPDVNAFEADLNHSNQFRRGFETHSRWN